MTVELHRDDLPPGRTFRRLPSPSTPRRLGSIPIATGFASCNCRAGDGNAELVQIGRQLPRAGTEAPARRRERAQDLPLWPLRHGRAQARFWRHAAARSTAPRSPRASPAPSPTGTASRISAKELLDIELSKQQQSSDWGADRAHPRAAQLCGERRVASARAKGETRGHAGARGPRGLGTRLLRLPADQGRARSAGLVARSIPSPIRWPGMAAKGASAKPLRSQCDQSPAANCRPVGRAVSEPGGVSE